MKKWLWVSCSVIVIIGVIVTWIFLRWRPAEIPKDLYIPGLESLREVDRSYEHIDFIAKIKHLGITYDCALELKIDQNNQLVLPTTDEAFTVVVSDEKDLELWRDDRKVGNVPIVFIALRHDPGFYRVGPPGSSQRPIVVSPNMVNLVSYVYDTVIKSPESIKIKVLKSGKEIASGEIPLNLKVGDDEVKVIVDGVQVRGYAGTGAFQFFTGEFPIKKGIHSIVASGRIFGANLWHEDGVFLGTDSGYGSLNEDKICFVGKDGMVVLLGNNRKEVRINDVRFDKLYGYPMINTPNVYVTSNDKLYIVNSKGDLSTKSDFQESSAWITPFYNLSPIPKSQMKPILANINKFMLEHLHIHYQQGCMIYSSPKSNNSIYSVKFDLTETAVLHRLDDKIIYFTDGNKCTEFMNVETGYTGLDIKNLQNKGILDWIKGDGLIFPSGHRVRKGITCLDAQGRTLWVRSDGEIERIGAIGLKVTNKQTGEVSCYDVHDGQLLASWKSVDACMAFLDERYMVITINNNHTIFIQRTINPNQI